MKNFYLTLIAVVFIGMNLNAQTLEELRAKKDELAAQASEAQARANALAGEISGLQEKIEILSGWRKGFAGTIGFDFNQANNWVSSPNPNASSTGLGLGLSAFANQRREKTLWNNKLIINKSYNDVDQNIPGAEDNDGLFDDENGVSDILNLSSLYGYRIHPKFAITALGELNTSIGSFLEPGTADIGVGGTWTPTNNLVVVVHPFNYRVAWSGIANAESTGALGAKIRADYNNNYNIAGRTVGFSSTFTTLLPYSKPLITDAVTGIETEADLFEYTWLNTVSFELWRGIGVGIGFGFRGADFEIQDKVQSYYNLGLSYNL